MMWEEEIGMEVYLTEGRCPGWIKDIPEDFIVEEEGLLGKAEVKELLGFKGEKEPRGSGDYLWVVMEKRDWDLNDVLKAVARRLGIGRNRISFAGTKDKYAVTAQWVSLWRIRWKELKSVRIRDVAFHTPVYQGRKLKRGMLKGNWFEVRIRGCRPAEVPRSFVNYFGHQRFGSYRFVSHRVGMHLVKEEYEEAVLVYLTESSPWEPEETRTAREKLRKNFDPKEALTYFPRRLRKERIILHALASGKNFKSAILSLPKNLVSLFIHAYQAYLFNRITSALVREGILEGDTLVPGYMSSLSPGEKGKIERRVLEEEEVELERFRRWKKFGTQGGRRKIIESPHNLERRGNMIKFFLPKNTYATAFLRELLKPQSPVGFLISPRKLRGEQTDQSEPPGVP